MNNATRITRREHERALRAEQRRKRNLAKKQQRLLTLGRTRDLRKPLSVRSREFAIEAFEIKDVARFDVIRADAALAQREYTLEDVSV
jgi:hypothetical protein